MNGLQFKKEHFVLQAITANLEKGLKNVHLDLTVSREWNLRQGSVMQVTTALESQRQQLNKNAPLGHIVHKALIFRLAALLEPSPILLYSNAKQNANTVLQLSTAKVVL